MKYRLLAPGPTPVPERVLSVMNRGIYHHRTPAFIKLFEKSREGLQWLLQTKNDVITLACSGTGTFEACIQNFFSPGDTVICVLGGKFGERLAEVSQAYGLNVVTIEVSWGEACDPKLVEQALASYKNARGVLAVSSETSTGALHPIAAIGKVVSNYPSCIFIVDGITSVGAIDIIPERDNIDVLLFASQKALMLPPGLGFLAISNKAWNHNKESRMPRFYFNLAKEHKLQSKGETAFTPPVQLIAGLAECINMMREEGREAIFARHTRMAQAVREAMKAINLNLFSKAPSDSVTSVCMPEGLPLNAVYTGLRDYANMVIAGGQEQLKGKIFRIAHMGYFDELDMLTMLSAIEIILQKNHYNNFTPGASIAAASKVLSPAF